MMKVLLLMLLVISPVILISGLNKSNITDPFDLRLNFIDEAEYLECSVQEYQVVTDDGYILKLFRIPGKSGLPVLLMHGILDSGDTWIVKGEKSMAVTLARAGYDVWIGNCRGNMYSRRHRTLDPDTDEEFWDFSFHEHGYYDLPALIDTVLNQTGAARLNAIGHSQGNTIFYVLGSTRPDYNEKVNVAIALAPVAFLHNQRAPWGPVLQLADELRNMKVIGVAELPSPTSLFYKLLRIVCMEPIGYDVCVQGVLFSVFGEDREEIPPVVWPSILAHVPHSTSLRNLIHYGQVAKSKMFSRYDYGRKKNLAVYNSSAPPSYQLGRVSMRVALLAGGNDPLCDLKDVSALRRHLSNVVHYSVLKRAQYNHVDFTWAENNDKYLFPLIFKILKKYDEL